MYDLAILWDWLAFAVRWLHVITAIAWIGSSFYFIALDLGLNRNIDGPADGEEWQVHGGGFYHIQKYLVAPKEMPEHLTWFKWESYATWLSGAAMLAVVYWAGSELYLIDPNVADLSAWQAIAISAASLAVGWIIYDLLCKSKLGETPTTLMLLLFALLVVMSWGYTQVFTGRAALLHLGAFTVFLMGVTIRHYFNTMHMKKKVPNWTIGATVILFIAIAWLSALGRPDYAEEQAMGPVATQFAQADGFERVEEIVLGRCSMCHAREPFWDGIHWAPKAVHLETTADIAAHARDIYLQAGVSHAMPPANLTYIEPSERAEIRAWYTSVRPQLNFASN